MSSKARVAYAIEKRLGFDKRESISTLQQFADNVCSKFSIPNVTVTAEPKLKGKNFRGYFRTPNSILVEPQKGQTKATVLHELVHAKDFRDRRSIPHDGLFRRQHWYLLRKIANYTK